MAEEIESLIRRADRADREATDKLFAVLYDELHRIAEHNLKRAGSSLTLGTTTLLHEAYVNIAGRENIAFAERSRFLAYASRAMRGLVIDYARSRRTKKRGRQFEPALAELVDLHFFCGFSFAEIAALRVVSERTVRRDWRKTRLLLQDALLHDEGPLPNEEPPGETGAEPR